MSLQTINRYHHSQELPQAFPNSGSQVSHMWYFPYNHGELFRNEAFIFGSPCGIPSTIAPLCWDHPPLCPPFTQLDGGMGWSAPSFPVAPCVELWSRSERLPSSGMCCGKGCRDEEKTHSTGGWRCVGGKLIQHKSYPSFWGTIWISPPVVGKISCFFSIGGMWTLVLWRMDWV